MNTLVHAIIEGIGLGITLAILTGPAFFALLQTSIRNGYRSGIAFALGVFVSDTILILLSYLGALQLFSDPKTNFVIGIIGGTILIVFGVFNIFQKSPLDTKKTDAHVEKLLAVKTSMTMISLKGFAINMINPFVILFWIGVVSAETTRYKFNQLDIVSLFCAALLTVLGTDILKALAAQRITSLLNPVILMWINRIVGVILVFSGGTLIWKVVDTFVLKGAGTAH